MTQPRRLRPTDLLDFVELKPFTKAWADLGLEDDDLAALQVEIMSHPVRGSLIKGTGGLRKLRFRPPSWATGKSGAARVCYVYFKTHAFVLLTSAYAKRAKADLSADEIRTLRGVIREIEKGLSRDVKLKGIVCRSEERRDGKKRSSCRWDKRSLPG